MRPKPVKRRMLSANTMPFVIRYAEGEQVVTQEFRYLNQAIDSGRELLDRGFEVVLSDVLNQQLIDLRVAV